MRQCGGNGQLFAHYTLTAGRGVYCPQRRRSGSGKRTSFGSLRGEGPGSHAGTVTFSFCCVHRAPLVHGWWESAQHRPSWPGPEPPAPSRSLWASPAPHRPHHAVSPKPLRGHTQLPRGASLLFPEILFIFCNCREGGESREHGEHGGWQAAGRTWEPGPRPLPGVSSGSEPPAFPTEDPDAVKAGGFGATRLCHDCHLCRHSMEIAPDDTETQFLCCEQNFRR